MMRVFGVAGDLLKKLKYALAPLALLLLFRPLIGKLRGAGRMQAI